MLGTSKSIWGFVPTSVPGCTLWLDGADNNSMNSSSAVTVWNDKSGNSNNVTGSGTWSGGTMVFNGSTNAFSNTTFVFPVSAYSMFAVYSNTTAPAASAYMNAVYGNGGFPMLGTYDVGRGVTARSVVANTGALIANVGWATRISSTGIDFPGAVATDSSGNVFVTGYYAAALTAYNTPGIVSGASLGFTGGPGDCFVAKYSSAGAVVWAAQAAGTTTSSDQGNGIVADLSGNVFVVGQYSAALTLYNGAGGIGASLANGGQDDCFIAKYNSIGAVQWAARIGSTTTDIGQGIAIDSSGNVVITGFYGAALTLSNANTIGGVGATLGYAGPLNQCFVAKYSSAGTALWAARIAGTGNNIGYAIATDPSDNVLVTGKYDTGELTIYNKGSNGTSGATIPLTGGGNDVFIAKYNSIGDVQWAARIASTGGDIGNGIATDPSGNVIVTGEYGAALTIYNQGAAGTSNVTLPFTGGGRDCFIAKYSSAGAVVWAARIASTGDDMGYGVTTDSSGNVFVTGQYNNTLTLYNATTIGGNYSSTLAPIGTNAAFVAKYSSNGTVLWATRAGGAAATSGGKSIATDSSGNVLVTGWYGSATTLYNSDTTNGATLSFAGGFYDTFIVKYKPDGFITNTSVPASSNVIVDATYTPSTMSPFANGTACTTRAGTTLAATGVFVGGPSNYFNGTISEVLIYNNTLTATQRQAVEGYLAYKWGIQSNLPTTQLYYSRPPFNRVFVPTDIATCSVWMDGGDNSTMNSTTSVTTWNDKSGNAFNMTGSGTWSGSNMVFNGSTNAFSNTGYVFPSNAYSLFAVYSNTIAPAAAAYMNVMYGANGFPMLGTFTSSTTFPLVANTMPEAYAIQSLACDSSGSNIVIGYNYSGFVWTARFNGTAWTWIKHTAVPGTVFIAKVASDSSGSNIAVAGSGPGPLCTARFNGSTWTWTTHTAPGTLNWTGIASDSTGSNLAACVQGGKVWLGKFNGSTWTWTQQTSSATTTWSGIASDASGSNLFITQSGASGAIWTGTFNGSTWTWTSRLAGGTQGWIGAGGIASSADGSRVVATITNGGATASTYFITGALSAGTWTWTQQTVASALWSAVASDSSGSNLFVGTNGSYLYSGSFNGSTWTWTPQTIGSWFGIASSSSGLVVHAGLGDSSTTSIRSGFGISFPNVSARAVVANTGALIANIAANSNVLVDATYLPSTMSPFINGTSTTTLAGTTLATTGLYLGGPTNYFNGTLSELIIYASTLTSGQRQAVEGYLAAKWGLRSSLISTQPYKILPPATAV